MYEYTDSGLVEGPSERCWPGGRAPLVSVLVPATMAPESLRDGGGSAYLTFIDGRRDDSELSVVSDADGKSSG